MRTVSIFEDKMLRLLYAVLERDSFDRAAAIIRAKHKPPHCLSRNAVELARNALRKGTALILAREAWRPERVFRPDADRTVEGRLWEREAPLDLGLSFSRHAMALLIWLTAQAPTESIFLAPKEELTLGDQLLMFWIYESSRHLDFARGLRASPPFARHGLIRLAFAGDFGSIPAESRPRPDFRFWLEPGRAWAIEALQRSIADCWTRTALEKERIRDLPSLRTMGQAESEALTWWLDAAEHADRRDLTRFLLWASRSLLRSRSEASQWVGWMPVSGLRLADRSAFYRDALALLEHLDRLQRWERDARSVGYFDEGYAFAQYWKREWELEDADQVAEHARRIIRQLQPLSPKRGGSGTLSPLLDSRSSSNPDTGPGPHDFDPSTGSSRP